MPSNINPNANMRAFVENVTITGLKQTRTELANAQLRHLLHDEVNTWADLMGAILVAKRRMQALGVFTQVDVTIDTAKTCKRTDLLPYAYDVTFEVSECKQMQYGVSTVAGMDGSMSLLLNGNLRNASGNAERLMFDYQIGNRDSKSKYLTLCAPLSFNPFAKFSVGLVDASVDQVWAALREKHSSAFSSLSLPTQFGDNIIRGELSWRQMIADSDTTPLAVRELCGHSVKCSVKHVFERDSRDASMLPSSGSLLRVTNEVAGFGGDTSFLRQLLQASFSLPLPLDASLQLQGSIGRVVGFGGGQQQVVSVQDRFTLGGASSGLRGFEINSTGPSVPRAADADAEAAGNQRANCYVGGTALATVGAHLYTRLPMLRGSFFDLFRLHAFVNAGSLLQLQPKRPSDFIAGDAARVAYGIGCLVALGGLARLEFNYTVPVCAAATDAVAPGFGVAVQVDSPL